MGQSDGWTVDSYYPTLRLDTQGEYKMQGKGENKGNIAEKKKARMITIWTGKKWVKKGKRTDRSKKEKRRMNKKWQEKSDSGGEKEKWEKKLVSQPSWIPLGPREGGKRELSFPIRPTEGTERWKKANRKMSALGPSADPLKTGWKLKVEMGLFGNRLTDSQNIVFLCYGRQIYVYRGSSIYHYFTVIQNILKIGKKWAPERTSDRCEAASERASGWARGLLSTARFQDVLKHCVFLKQNEYSLRKSSTMNVFFFTEAERLGFQCSSQQQHVE